LHHQLSEPIYLLASIADEIECFTERFATSLTLKLAAIKLEQHCESTDA
jgi:hypothetical protein